MIYGWYLINSTLSRPGLRIHLGKGEAGARTEVMCITGAIFYNSPIPEIPSLPLEATFLISLAEDMVNNGNNYLTPPN